MRGHWHIDHLLITQEEKYSLTYIALNDICMHYHKHLYRVWTHFWRENLFNNLRIPNWIENFVAAWAKKPIEKKLWWYFWLIPSQETYSISPLIVCQLLEVRNHYCNELLLSSGSFLFDWLRRFTSRWKPNRICESLKRRPGPRRWSGL